MEKIPDNYPLVEGKLTCVTCHDMYKQCPENPDLRVLIASKKEGNTELI
jgi:NAD-dependent dihydropyrimidine dehydrogenase PreA subunit